MTMAAQYTKSVITLTFPSLLASQSSLTTKIPHFGLLYLHIIVYFTGLPVSISTIFPIGGEDDGGVGVRDDVGGVRRGSEFNSSIRY